MQFLLNLLARTALIYLFTHFGWMTLLVDGQPIHGFGWHLLFAFIGGILLAIVNLLLIIPGLILAAATLGLALLVFGTIINSASLWVISLIFNEHVVLQGFWLTVLCGFIISLTTRAVAALFRSSDD